MEHGIGVRDPEGRAQSCQHARRIGQEVGAFDDRRRPTEAVRLLLEELALLDDADVCERHLAAPGDVRRQHRSRIANEERIADLREPFPAEGRDHVMRHVLLVVHRLVCGHATQEPRHDIAPVVGMRGDHLVSHRMGEACVQEVRGVERLVDHCSVGTSAERAHQRGGDVARTGPHCDPKRWLLHLRRCRKRRTRKVVEGQQLSGSGCW
jgi:hypothetical protein